MNMKDASIKLVQLPIPEVNGNLREYNIPLAAGYLKAMAVKSRAAQRNEIEIAPQSLTNHAGDSALITWLTREETAIIGFSSYMWNIERNLFIAGKVKELRADIQIIFGGPEVVPEQWFLEDPAVDVFVFGEGEQAFSDFLTDYKNGISPLGRFYKSETPLDLKKVPNPYLEGILTPSENESVLFETMRGCPYPCNFCFYSKSSSDLRFFPEDDLPKLFDLLKSYRVSEIYLMDPSFNVTPALKSRLELLAKLNTSNIPIHSEIRLESITPEIAKLMKKAGFVSVEVGLQTINEKSLVAIHRTLDIERFIRGSQLLKEYGIEVKTGVILGLPHDSLEEIERTLDFLNALDLRDLAEIYFLSMLPGTVIRDSAKALGIRYMKRPPYWITSTKYLGKNDLKYAVEMVEEKLETEFFLPFIPKFKNDSIDYIHFLDLRKNLNTQVDKLFHTPGKIGNTLAIMISRSVDIEKLSELANWLKQTNPFTLVQVIFDMDELPPKVMVKKVSQAFDNPDHYINRLHQYKIDFQGRYNIRVFHLTANLDIAESYYYETFPCDLIVRYTPVLLTKGEFLLEQKAMILVDSPAKSTEIKELSKIYEGFEEYLIIEKPRKGLF